jgi:tetratricopeptide (TPR) repeat protein
MLGFPLAGHSQESIQTSDAGQATGIAALEQKIQRLIEQLGDRDFARRERAQAELERIGLDAFDFLRDATTHEDIEIAWRAKYLLRRLQDRIYSDRDSPEVRRIISDYFKGRESDRRSLLDRLLNMPDAQGLTALCRLVRFEIDHQMAKYGALQVLQHDEPQDSAERRQRATLIREAIALSRSPAVQWLRAYADWLEDPDKADPVWSEILESEIRTLATYPEQTSPEIVRGLLQWRVEKLWAAGRRQQATELVPRIFSYVSDRREELLGLVDWLIKLEMYEPVHELAARFPDAFRQSLLLQYRLAEAHYRQGKQQEAENLAQRALASLPDNWEEHIQAGLLLEEKGLLDWAEREFKLVIESAGPNSADMIRARVLLAELYHDQLRELEAAKALEPIVEAAQNNPEFANRVRNIRQGRDLNEIVARMHFFFAEHYATVDRAQQKEHLQKAIEAFPQEIDVLIAMYRFPEADETWMRQTRERINDTLGYYRDQIRKFTDNMQRNLEPSLEGTFRAYLAQLHNQLAWLVANTEGDFDEALRSSLKSLEYRPGTAAYLDTLARCYYAKKDYANAVKYQRQALELEPFSGQMRRQLKLFEDALAAASAERPK